jgi:spermidine synthase
VRRADPNGHFYNGDRPLGFSSMNYEFKELDFQQTPHGEISLRRRAEPRLDGLVLYEVKLGEEFLMSSLFTEAEEQLAVLGLELLDQEQLDVVVGGLGLGYTAQAALKNERLRSLTVIEVLQPVVDWHKQGLVPLGNEICGDSRCSLVTGDFFAMATSAISGFDETAPDKKVHAVLLDIDHSPSHWLNPGNHQFYTAEGLTCMAQKLHANGVFGLWSNDPPESDFVKLLESVFRSVRSEIVAFPNPYSGGTSANTVYLAIL